jgi:hypothetical protein
MIILCLKNLRVYSKLSKKEEESQWLKSGGGKKSLIMMMMMIGRDWNRSMI